MKRTLAAFLLTPLFVLFSTSLIPAQEKDVKPAEEEGPKFYEATEIPQQIENITSVIKEIEKNLEAMGDGKDFDSVFAEYKEGVAKLEEEVDLTELETYFEAKLQDLRIRWEK